MQSGQFELVLMINTTGDTFATVPRTDIPLIPCHNMGFLHFTTGTSVTLTAGYVTHNNEKQSQRLMFNCRPP